MTDDPTDSIDLEHAAGVTVGATRGEFDTEIGPPRDYPDRAELSVSLDGDGGVEGETGLVLAVDVAAGDHAVGRADVPLSVTEARTLRDALDEAIRQVDGSEV
ncbi:hypothetical protein OB905_07010 [Halobacteria archaeon AArc-dxtr1]|nr:hypothetical protein [Halobacteria archaeon AArc-dxtr1]